MNELLPIIRRVRRPLKSAAAPPVVAVAVPLVNPPVVEPAEISKPKKSRDGVAPT